MPTWTKTERFRKDYESLSSDQKIAFLAAVSHFVQDLKSASGFRPSLRVKGIRGAPNVFEMTGAPDGRATFQYGKAVSREPHIIWRRVGTHDIYGRP